MLGSPTRLLKETWARQRPDMDPSDYLFQIYGMRLGQLIEREFDRFCRKTFRLSGADARILIVLKRSSSSHAPKPAELAETQMMTTGAITKQLVRLEQEGYLERRPQTGEGGGIAIYATAKGLQLADEAMSALVGCPPFADMKHSLSKTERDELARLCERLLLRFEHL